jgi:flagellin-specific chaperone FliS
MSSLKKETETKNTMIFETETHIFKLAEEKLDKFNEDKSPKSLRKLRTIIQKGMKQKVEVSSGVEWENSFELIFSDITGGQRIL